MNDSIKSKLLSNVDRKFSYFFLFTLVLSTALIYFDFLEYEKYKVLTHERVQNKTRAYPNSLASDKENRIISLLNKIELTSSFKDVEQEFEEIEKLDPDNAYITVLKIRFTLGENSFKTDWVEDWQELVINDKEKVFLALNHLNQTAQKNEYKQYWLNDIKHQNAELTKNWPAVAAHRHHNHMIYDLGIIRSVVKIVAAMPDNSRDKNLTHIRNIIHLKNLLLTSQPDLLKIYLNAAFNEILLPTLIEYFPQEFEKEIQTFKNEIGAKVLLETTRVHHLGAHFQYFFDTDFDRQAFDFKYGGKLQLLFFSKIFDRFSLIMLLALSVFSEFIFLRYWKLNGELKNSYTFPKTGKILKTFLIIFFLSLLYSIIISYTLRDPSPDDDVCGLYDYIQNQISLLLLLKFVFLNLILVLPVIHISHKNRLLNGSQTHWTMTLMFPLGYLTAIIPTLYFIIILLEWKVNLIYAVLTIELIILIILLLKFYRLFAPHKNIKLTLQNVYKTIIYLCIFCLSQQLLASTFYRSIESYHFDSSMFYVPNINKGSCETEIYHQQIEMYQDFLTNKIPECKEYYEDRIKDFPLKKMILVEEFTKK